MPSPTYGCAKIATNDSLLEYVYREYDKLASEYTKMLERISIFNWWKLPLHLSSHALIDLPLQFLVEEVAVAEKSRDKSPVIAYIDQKTFL